MMKKIIFAVGAACFFIAPIFANGWQDKWSEAILLLEKGEPHFIQATSLLNEAITLIEAEKGKSLPYLYVDRARLNLVLRDDKGAIEDAEKALSIEMLDANGKTRALVTKLIANVRLGNLERAEIDLKAFAENHHLPFIDIDNSKVIIRNVPENEYYKKMIACYLIHCGFCYDFAAFDFLKSGILIAESHCGCQKCLAEYAKTRECDVCSSLISPTKSNISLNDLVLTAISYCADELVQLDDQIAFLTAVCQMQDIGSSLELFEDTFKNILGSLKKAKIHWD